MRQKFLIILSVVYISLCGSIGAQIGDETCHLRRERIEALRIWKMTEELGLSSEQAALFFPKLNEFEKGIKLRQEERRKTLMEFKERLSNPDYKPGESDVKNLCNKLAEIERDILLRRENFINEISGILTPEQQIKYIIFEDQFRQHLIRILQQERKKKR